MTYNVHEIQERYAVGEATVLGWIHGGELAAINVGKEPGKKKPRWRITEAALQAFELLRSSEAPAPKPVRRTRKRSADQVVFFK